ncbi:hypothetical protein OH76DRAFT_1345140 [Lentinus brumalis]|uniref:Uncharacterized protein n=1 Tax=Lentinus brumalis TaxID=2498619 RepID=A0A371DJ54_9APHY|nr:hypothetical protein OH76DRAFT_1345140 [Polyporus brumalis]
MLVVPWPDAPLFPGIDIDTSIALLAHFDIDALVRVRFWNHLGDQYTSATLTRRIAFMLSPAFSDYEAFVHELQLTSSVVGGQAALHVFHPSEPAPRVIAIYTPHRTFFHVLGYLVHQEDFELRITACEASPIADEPPPLEVTLTKGRYSFLLVPGAKESPTPLHPLVSMWNSALCAYFGPNSFCDAYTGLNEHSRGLIHPSRLALHGQLPADLGALIRTWTARGWALSNTPSAWVGATPCRGAVSIGCAAAVRFFGDAHCTSGVLLPLGETLPRSVGVDLLQEYSVVWWRGGRTCGGGCHYGETSITGGKRLCLRSVLITT